MYVFKSSNCHYRNLRVKYSQASKQRTLWERAFCPLFGGCPYLGGLPLFDYSIFQHGLMTPGMHINT